MDYSESLFANFLYRHSRNIVQTVISLTVATRWLTWPLEVKEHLQKFCGCSSHFWSASRH